ncbi:hypothetical protein [Couchioplanes caeruleus]|uniref:hypothetical protein n=1 Tax=Couchioplanes caeruleus TaxID=56438 RepID=UPI000B1D8A4A|nr:hypothetical protein [Couchioplanes caeruleus]
MSSVVVLQSAGAPDYPYADWLADHPGRTTIAHMAGHKTAGRPDLAVAGIVAEHLLAFVGRSPAGG